MNETTLTWWQGEGEGRMLRADARVVDGTWSLAEEPDGICVLTLTEHQDGGRAWTWPTGSSAAAEHIAETIETGGRVPTDPAADGPPLDSIFPITPDENRPEVVTGHVWRSDPQTWYAQSLLHEVTGPYEGPARAAADVVPEPEPEPEAG
jgi:hypothetical protein